MKARPRFLYILLAFVIGCAGATSPNAQKTPLPLKDVNLNAVLEENSGLEASPENIKDARDYYRTAVQQKAKAEEALKEKSYEKALQSYEESNDSMMKLREYFDTDSANFTLFEGMDVLFFPNLLEADNFLKMGRILQDTGKEGNARREWKKGLSFVRRSLKEQPTEWGLAVQQELESLLAGEK